MRCLYWSCSRILALIPSQFGQLLLPFTIPWGKGSPWDDFKFFKRRRFIDCHWLSTPNPATFTTCYIFSRGSLKTIHFPLLLGGWFFQSIFTIGFLREVTKVLKSFAWNFRNTLSSVYTVYTPITTGPLRKRIGYAPDASQRIVKGERYENFQRNLRKLSKL